MTAPSVGLAGAPVQLLRQRSTIIFWVALIAVAAAAFFIPDLAPWADNYPTAWIVPVRGWISDFMGWLINELDFRLFTFQEFTRAIAWLLGWPLQAANWALWRGIEISETVHIPSLSWVAVIICLTMMGYAVGGWRLAMLAGACFLYLAVFGQWGSAMMTLASILVAVPIGCAFGLILGVFAYRNRYVEAMVTPILDFMQTMPAFAYLVPVLLLFGFGPISAMIATIIYAMPPMVRATTLGLKLVSPEIVEFGRMAGCSSRQLISRVLIPSARPTLMVGVNQVIMLSLNMVIIASMIGAGGLGFDVLSALKSLKIGQGVEAGVAIVLIAITLDRLSQTFAAKPPPVHEEKKKSFVGQHPYLLMATAVIIGTLIAGYLVPAIGFVPESLTVTTAPFWADLVTWITVNFFDYLYAAKTFMLLNVLVPFKRFLLEVPWVTVVAFLGVLGWRLGGWRLAATVLGLATFIAITGFWDKAMISVYLIGISVVIASAIGLPLGIWSARDDRVSRVMHVIIDTLQTLPSFVYLVPVVMVFQVGDVSAIVAVIAYALAPAIRYTDHGLRNVPPALIEAARAAGCSARQILWKVQLPIALPEIMLGINQTIMLAISMLVITALVGTTDLGQEVYIGLARADIGRGVVAGICVAFIAIIADRLMQAWSKKRKEKLGLA